MVVSAIVGIVIYSIDSYAIISRQMITRKHKDLTVTCSNLGEGSICFQDFYEYMETASNKTLTELEKTYVEYVDHQIKFFDEMITILETKMDEAKQTFFWEKKKSILKSEVFFWCSRCSPMMNEKEHVCLEQCKILFSKLE